MIIPEADEENPEILDATSDIAAMRTADKRIHLGPPEPEGEASSVAEDLPRWCGRLAREDRPERIVLPEGSGSRPVSRVLSKAAIHLRRTSPYACSDLPGSGAGHAWSPAGDPLPYLVLLRVGFTLPPVLPPARCALTAPFHPCLASSRTGGGLFSVALSVGSRPPGVTWHPALRSPDFPPPRNSKQRLPGRLPLRTV